MTIRRIHRMPSSLRRPAVGFLTLIALAGCASMRSSPADPRVGLKSGLTDAAEAKAHLNVLSNRPSPPVFDQTMNADLAFIGQYAIQGNFNGPVVWDVSNPANPTLVSSI